MNKIIGICGEKGSGKDTVADYILSKRSNYKKVAFADPIKEALLKIFDWKKEHLYTDLKNKVDERYGVSPRVAMTTLGTEWGQFLLCKHGEEFIDKTGRKLWVYKTFSEITKNKDFNFLISDVRFLHEVEEIRRYDGLIIKVIKSKGKVGFIKKFFRHKSERDFDKIKADLIIENLSTKEDLFLKIDSAMKELNI